MIAAPTSFLADAFLCHDRRRTHWRGGFVFRTKAVLALRRRSRIRCWCAEIAPHLINEPSSLLGLVVALVFGVLGALLALFLQKVAIAVLGFLAGGKLSRGAIGASFFIHSAQYYDDHFSDGRDHRNAFCCWRSLVGHSSSSPRLLART